MADEHDEQVVRANAFTQPAVLQDVGIKPFSRLVVPESCGNCRYRHKEQDGDVICRRRAPQVTVLLVPKQMGPLARPGPNGANMQQLVPMPFTSFPLVNDLQWCGDWEAVR